MEPFSLSAALKLPQEETQPESPERTCTSETRADHFVPTAAMDQARERAIAFLVNRGIEERRAADGRNVGIQSTISTSADGEHAIDLYKIVDGMVADSARGGAAAANDPSRMSWQLIADEVEARLGFPLEPELFSNMLFVAYVSVVDHSAIRGIARALLSTYVRSDVRGLYHFFTSLRFACDIDCTAVAAKGRLLIGELDPTTKRGAERLRRINDRILRSAAVSDVTGETNASHGKDNGSLCRHVFKVYLDDHEVQGAEFDRGLKNNPVVSSHALFPVLAELSWGLRALDETVPLKEYPCGAAEPRTGHATVAEIVAANLGYVTGHLLTGDWRHGCRYYGSPDAFLCACSQIAGEFVELSEIMGLDTALIEAIDERRQSTGVGIADPHGPLNLALRAIAAGNLRIDRTPELDELVALQDDNGSWSRFAPLFCFGTDAPRLYFGSSMQTTAFAVRALAPTSQRAAYRGNVNPWDALAEAVLDGAAGHLCRHQVTGQSETRIKVSTGHGE
jgi:hypothetical protein